MNIKVIYDAMSQHEKEEMIHLLNGIKNKSDRRVLKDLLDLNEVPTILKNIIRNSHLFEGNELLENITRDEFLKNRGAGYKTWDTFVLIRGY